MARMPVVFVSHGSPEIAVRDSPAHRFLKSFGKELPRPGQILVISAHWETEVPAVATGDRAATIYDFGSRFDKRLWEIVYDAPGAPKLARRVAELIEANCGIAVGEDAGRGRDHGVWTPLYLAYPEMDVPVTQLSIQPHRDPAYHFKIGSALEPLRDEGVLIVASGAITHNLSEIRGKTIDSPEEPWVAAFRDWMATHISAGETVTLLDYRARAPEAARNHPEDEHLLPIFAALGAAGDDTRGRRVHASVQSGVIGMDVYQWG